jgi:uncharacterized membrane protein YeaQ/YmgE (transglycosylase-associated protein family)
MSLFYYALYGFFVGVLAKSLFHKEDKGGVFFTIILGMLGSLTSGVLLSYFDVSITKSISVYGLIPAVLGAVLLLGTYHFIRGLFYHS